MMTISQASNVNTLLNWILDMDRGGALGKVHNNDARAAAASLAEQAHKALSAGISELDVLRGWDMSPTLTLKERAEVRSNAKVKTGK